MSDQVRAEQQIAWELHVELVTRIATVTLPEREGLLDEALSSLAAMADAFRQILHGYQPNPDRSSVGHQVEVVADTVLARIVDPFVLRWQPQLAGWLADRPVDVGKPDHERSWPKAVALRTDLAGVQARLRPLAEQLAELADAASLLR